LADGFLLRAAAPFDININIYFPFPILYKFDKKIRFIDYLPHAVWSRYVYFEVSLERARHRAPIQPCTPNSCTDLRVGEYSSRMPLSAPSAPLARVNSGSAAPRRRGEAQVEEAMFLDEDGVRRGALAGSSIDGEVRARRVDGHGFGQALAERGVEGGDFGARLAAQSRDGPGQVRVRATPKRVETWMLSMRCEQWRPGPV
jgi:hypothetical protein